MDLSSDRRRIDINDAGVEVTHCPEGVVDVLGVDGRGEAILHAVRYPDRFVKRVDGDDRRHRSEDLLLCYTHLRPYLRKNGRLMEVAMRVVTIAQALASDQYLRSFLLADLHVLQDGFILLPVDRRSHRHLLVEPAPDLQLACALRQPSAKLIRDGAVGDDPARGRAALARRPKRTPDRSFEHQIEVGVLHDDDGILAAHLQRDALECLCGNPRDVVPDLGRAREGDYLYVRVPDERLACLR